MPKEIQLLIPLLAVCIFSFLRISRPAAWKTSVGRIYLAAVIVGYTLLVISMFSIVTSVIYLIGPEDVASTGIFPSIVPALVKDLLEDIGRYLGIGGERLYLLEVGILSFIVVLIGFNLRVVQDLDRNLRRYFRNPLSIRATMNRTADKIVETENFVVPQRRQTELRARAEDHGLVIAGDTAGISGDLVTRSRKTYTLLTSAFTPKLFSEDVHREGNRPLKRRLEALQAEFDELFDAAVQHIRMTIAARKALADEKAGEPDGDGENAEGDGEDDPEEEVLVTIEDVSDAIRRLDQHFDQRLKSILHETAVILIRCQLAGGKSVRDIEATFEEIGFTDLHWEWIRIGTNAVARTCLIAFSSIFILIAISMANAPNIGATAAEAFANLSVIAMVFMSAAACAVIPTSLFDPGEFRKKLAFHFLLGVLSIIIFLAIHGSVLLTKLFFGLLIPSGETTIHRLVVGYFLNVWPWGWFAFATTVSLSYVGSLVGTKQDLDRAHWKNRAFDSLAVGLAMIFAAFLVLLCGTKLPVPDMYILPDASNTPDGRNVFEVIQEGSVLYFYLVSFIAGATLGYLVPLRSRRTARSWADIRKGLPDYFVAERAT